METSAAARNAQPKQAPPAENRLAVAERAASVALASAAQSSAQSSAPAATPASSESSAGGASAAPGQAGSPRDGVSPDALREYRMGLAVEARRFKRYPPLARERGWEGTVEAAVSGGGLTQPRVSLERSSGYPVLDEQTLDMVQRAANHTPVPEALRGREFRIVLPVRFSLDE